LKGLSDLRSRARRTSGGKKLSRLSLSLGDWKEENLIVKSDKARDIWGSSAKNEAKKSIVKKKGTGGGKIVRKEALLLYFCPLP